MSMSLQDQTEDDESYMPSEVPTVSMSESAAPTEIPKSRQWQHNVSRHWPAPAGSEVPTEAPNLSLCVLTVQPVRGLPVLEGFGGAG